MNAHIRRLLIVVAALLPAALGAQAAQNARRCNSASSLRVLFIGNSFTYVQNVPRMVEDIAASLPGPCISTAMIADGGATLEDHWNADTVVKHIRTGKWTHVVLNDQSTFGESWFLEGQLRVGGSAELLRYSRQFANEIRASHATPVLYAHWTNDNAPARDQDALDAAFASAAQSSRGVISPVGGAIKKMRASMTDLTPYFSDDHHLSPAGAYLAALVTYGTLTGRSPIGAASRLSGPAVELERGIVYPDSIISLVDLPQSVAIRVQQIAVNALAKSRKHSPPIRVPSLTSELPRVNAGERIANREQLNGHWRGTSTFLPTASGQPVSVDLFVNGIADSAVVNLPEENVRVRGPRHFSGRAQIGVANDVVHIEAPVAPNNGIAKLRATLNADVLSGVAEVEIMGPGMRVFHSIGRFSIRRIRDEQAAK